MCPTESEGQMVVRPSREVPFSLILYLQSAPVQTIWNAFVQDCAARSLSLYSSAAQRFAASLFINHHASVKYPPRSSSLKALLKQYITAIDNYQSTQHHKQNSSHASYSHDRSALSPAHPSRHSGRRGLCYDAYDAYDQSDNDEDGSRSSSRSSRSRSSRKDVSSCYTSENSPRYSVGEAAWALGMERTDSHDLDDDDDDDPVRLELMQKYIELSIQTNKDTDAEFCFKTFHNSFHRIVPSHMCGGAPATSAGRWRSNDNNNNNNTNNTKNKNNSYSCNRSNNNTDCSSISRDSEQKNTRVTKYSDVVEPDDAEARAVSRFSSVRVSSLQYQNVGLALWPAALVLVQLLAQELQGQTRLFLDLLNLMSDNKRDHDGNIKSSSSSSNNSSEGNAGYTGNDRKHSRASAHSYSAGSSRRRHGTSKKHTGRSRAHKTAQFSSLRILELGAGVGLTPVMLHTLPEYGQRVVSFVASDYESVMLNNMAYNFGINGVRATVDESCEECVEVYGTPPHGGDKVHVDSQSSLSCVSGLSCSSMHTRQKHCHGHNRSSRQHHNHNQQHVLAKLNWRDACGLQQLLQRWPCNVVLAADCIYDVSCISSLVSVIHTCLEQPSLAESNEASSTASGSAAASCAEHHVHAEDVDCAVSACDEHRPDCVVVVVQTHRQNSTMKLFFDEVREFAQIRSYSVVTGGSHTHTLSRDSDDEFITLQRDNGDGEQESRDADKDSACRTRDGVVPECVCGESHCVTNLCSRLTGLHPDEVLEDGSLRSMHTVELENSDRQQQQQQHSMHEDKRNGAHSSGEANAKLQDTMLGPFYVAMAGLIGVHILTLKTS